MHKLNNLKRVFPNKMALGSKEEITKLKDHGIASYISEDGDYEIKTCTIDNFSKENNLDIGLIKLDIEGYGLEAIKGATNIIRNNKPVLLISIYHNADDKEGFRKKINNMIELRTEANGKME